MDIETLNKVKEEAYWRLGQEAFEAGRYEEALDYYNKVLELNPHRADELSGKFQAVGREGACATQKSNKS